MTNLTKNRAVPDKTPTNPLNTNNIYAAFAKIALPISFGMLMSGLCYIAVTLLPFTETCVFLLLLSIFVLQQRELSNKLTMENAS